ncbi:ABC-2 family transporter protein [Paenibacillus sp. PK4536]|jgi:ABC-2 type transport system permease protein|uniref:ABC transporter permease protein n=1 Tax=Paenibacillus nuruki TaxID=1886670 RepID=A0A1E3L5G4_9BACL|nr:MULTISPECIES: ABC-2 family transporter protein [Paenibacillus]ODP28998.1 hypothetical protein PTI45_01507 [Paenibacillus nuruki]TKJ92198.1 ABC transporter permease [Paenibacillus sp. CFBP13512]WIM37473.1 ABC-2 family transporter protein [Paenibacillus sp. PK4536]CAJ1315985.1 ABC transporter permease [Paenibacillus nuruki]
MQMIWKEAKRYSRIYGRFMKFSVMSQMEYRTNFITAFLIETAYLLIKLLYAILPYQVGTDINGWSPDAILLYVGVFTIMSGLYSGLFFTNFTQLPDKVRTGSLDVLITKPISLQFAVTLRQFELGYTIPNVLGGSVMVAIGWSRMGLPVDFYHIGGFIFFIAIGVLVAYSVFLLPQLLAFWTVQTTGVTDMSNSVFETNYVPMAVYDRIIQRLGTFLLPVFVICNFPPMFVMGGLSAGMVWWAVLAPIWLLIIIRVIWRYALRHYSSASQ